MVRAAPLELQNERREVRHGDLRRRELLQRALVGFGPETIADARSLAPRAAAALVRDGELIAAAVKGV